MARGGSIGASKPPGTEAGGQGGRSGNLRDVIDLRALREDPDRLRASQRARGEDDAVVDTLLQLEERRRGALTSFEQLRAEQKSIGKSVSRAQGDERQQLLDRAKELS